MKGNSKIDIRNSKQLRSSKSAAHRASQINKFVGSSDLEFRIRFRFRHSAFGFRISDLLRVSDFGFRVLTAVLAFLALPAFSATNVLSAADDLPQLRPPRAEIPPTFWERYGVWVIVGSIAFVALMAVAVWLVTRPKPPVMVPPEVRAKQALEPLLVKPEDGLVLSQVSQTLRRYITEAFALPPGEQTTSEFCRLIVANERLGPELAGAISEFLRRCDERKFTPSPPSAPIGAPAIALKFVEAAQNRLADLRQRTEQVSAA